MADLVGFDEPAVTHSGTLYTSPAYYAGTSVLAQSQTGGEPGWSYELDPAWLRWYLGCLYRDTERLGRGVELLVQEVPRLKEFRRRVQELLGCPWAQRVARQRALVQLVSSSRVPAHYVRQVLRECSTGGGPNGLDVGIDLLSHLGQQVLEEAEDFVKKDQARWRGARHATHHLNDDVWYILLRALARSDVSASNKLPILRRCALLGSRGVREAAARALGDVGGEEARQLLQELVTNDSDTLVRQSAQEELDDLEN